MIARLRRRYGVRGAAALAVAPSLTSLLVPNGARLDPLSLSLREMLSFPSVTSAFVALWTARKHGAAMLQPDTPCTSALVAASTGAMRLALPPLLKGSNPV